MKIKRVQFFLSACMKYETASVCVFIVVRACVLSAYLKTLELVLMYHALA
jgi:hypothetical protein